MKNILIFLTVLFTSALLIAQDDKPKDSDRKRDRGAYRENKNRTGATRAFETCLSRLARTIEHHEAGSLAGLSCAGGID